MTLVMQKLKSQDGASIILALLLLLLCIMVGSSILAAGVSNAGKSKSHQEAQQEYFMVKSAIELVCGELEKMQYVGKYKYKREDVSGKYKLTYEMQKGSLLKTPDDPSEPSYTNLTGDFGTSLSAEFDKLYAVSFYNAVNSTADEVYNREYTRATDINPDFEKDATGSDIEIDGKKIPKEKQTSSHKFNIKIKDSASPSPFPGFDSNRPLKDYTVDVTVEIVESDLSLKITAEISGTGSNKMEAWMKLKTGSVFTVPTDFDSTSSEIIRLLNPSLTWETKYIRKAVDR